MIHHTKTFTVEDVSITAIVGDHCTKPLEKGRWYEQALLRYVRDLRLKGTYLDIGAFIGNHASYFAQKTDAERVLAFEPNPDVFNILWANGQANGFDAFHTLIVPHAQENDEFVQVDGPAGNCGMTRFERTGNPAPRNGDAIFSVTERHAESLADILCFEAEYTAPPVTLIKIDVEGNPAELLDARFVEELGTSRPHFIIEANTLEEQLAVDQILLPLGYKRNPKNLAATPTFHWYPEV